MSDTDNKLKELYDSLEAEDKVKLQELEDIKNEADNLLDYYNIPKLNSTLERLKYAKGRI